MIGGAIVISGVVVSEVLVTSTMKTEPRQNREYIVEKTQSGSPKMICFNTRCVYSIRILLPKDNTHHCYSHPLCSNNASSGRLTEAAAHLP